MKKESAFNLLGVSKNWSGSASHDLDDTASLFATDRLGQWGEMFAKSCSVWNRADFGPSRNRYWPIWPVTEGSGILSGSVNKAIDRAEGFTQV